MTERVRNREVTALRIARGATDAIRLALSTNNKGFHGTYLHEVLEVLAPGAQPATLHQDMRGLPTPRACHYRGPTGLAATASQPSKLSGSRVRVIALARHTTERCGGKYPASTPLRRGAGDVERRGTRPGRERKCRVPRHRVSE